jgi:hypothetical protein
MPRRPDELPLADQFRCSRQLGQGVNRPWRLRRGPYVPGVIWPRVDGPTVTEHLEDLRLVQLGRRVDVQGVRRAGSRGNRPGAPGSSRREAFVDGPPPRAPRIVRTRRGEDPTPDLPLVRRPSCGHRAACNRYAPDGGSWPAESGMCCPAGLDGRFASKSALHPAGRVLTSSQRS